MKRGENTYSIVSKINLERERMARASFDSYSAGDEEGVLGVTAELTVGQLLLYQR